MIQIQSIPPHNHIDPHKSRLACEKRDMLPWSSRLDTLLESLGDAFRYCFERQ